MRCPCYVCNRFVYMLMTPKHCFEHRHEMEYIWCGCHCHNGISFKQKEKRTHTLPFQYCRYLAMFKSLRLFANIHASKRSHYTIILCIVIWCAFSALSRSHSFVRRFARALRFESSTRRTWCYWSYSCCCNLLVNLGMCKLALYKLIGLRDST